jgi:hypothetical protein
LIAGYCSNWVSKALAMGSRGSSNALTRENQPGARSKQRETLACEQKREERLTAVLRTPNSVLSGAGAGTEGVSMKLVNSSEYSDLYSSLLAMIVAKEPHDWTGPLATASNASPLNISQQTTRNCVPLTRRAKAPKKLGRCPRVGWRLDSKRENFLDPPKHAAGLVR